MDYLQLSMYINWNIGIWESILLNKLRLIFANYANYNNN